MLRAPAALALGIALLAACGREEGQDCPGEPVATFHFSGTKVPAGDPSVPAGLDPVTAPDCAAPIVHPASMSGFDGTLSAEPASPAAALCTARGPVLLGTQAGERYALETSTAGAVLGACGETCSASLRLAVAGDLVRVDGEPASFGGVLVEELSARAGSDCGACALPCAARYLLAGTR